MIFFRGSGGRLGNQLFHLSALDKLCEGKHTGILFGCRELRHAFHWRRHRVFISKWEGERLFVLLKMMAKHSLASRSIEGKNQTNYGPIDNGKLRTLDRGFLPLSYVEDAYLQSDCWMRDDFRRMLMFRTATVQAVEEFGASHAIDWESSIFVHVRRGDYLNWNVFGGGSAALPIAYYRRGIERLRSKMQVSRVLFVTDDPSCVQREFDDVAKGCIISNTAIFDMCLMSRCASGVMSASSFSWWGAILGPQRVAPVAPEHWLGWNQGVTIPANIVSKRFDVIAVRPA